MGSNVVVVPGDAKLFEALLSSPICRNEDGTGGGEFDFGIDGDDDPELALVTTLIFNFLLTFFLYK